jgi:hypothetical protein
MSQMTPLKTIRMLVSAIFRQFAVALDFLILQDKHNIKHSGVYFNNPTVLAYK